MNYHATSQQSQGMLGFGKLNTTLENHLEADVKIIQLPIFGHMFLLASFFVHVIDQHFQPK
jgi:hypothetical protein